MQEPHIMIPDNRLKGSDDLAQARIIQQRLLDVFAAICEKHKLRYWLDYGTLIGALRHDGYIPWDDDIDVSMPIQDYKKFLRVVKRELPEDVLLDNLRERPGSCFSFCKLRDRYSFFCESDTVASLPSGVFIDIFTWTKVPKLPRSIIKVWCRLQAGCLRRAGSLLSKPRRSPIRKICDCMLSSGWKSMYWFFYGTFVITRYVLPSKTWRTQQDIAFEGYATEDDLFPTEKHVFEGVQYCVPHRPGEVLQQEFGDWMTLPPESERRVHATIINATVTPPGAKWALKWDPRHRNLK